MTLRCAGTLIVARNVIPRPASTDAQTPARLGVATAMRQGMPASSRRDVAVARIAHGPSATTSSTGSEWPPRAGVPFVRPTHDRSTSAICRACFDVG